MVRIDDSTTAPDSPHIDEVRDQLARILASTVFRNSPRLARFLNFVVETTLAGNGERIKAYTIAIEALGRGPDFNPEVDAIVRVEAGRLRAALARYYAAEGRDDSLVIDLPRGNYVPTFRRGSFASSSPTTARTTENLRSESRRIRDLLVSLTAAFLQKIAVDPFGEPHEINSGDAEHFLRTAEECFRCAGLLEATGHELMTKAVEIETSMQRDKKKDSRADFAELSTRGRRQPAD